jgi:hypothetical protein
MEREIKRKNQAVANNSGNSHPSATLSLPSFRPWREIAILAILIMEMCWIVPWFRSLTPATYATDPSLAFGTFIGIALVLHWTIRGMNYLQLRMNIRRFVLFLAILVSVLLGLKVLLHTTENTSIYDLLNGPLKTFNQMGTLIPDELIIIVFVLIACWRGIKLAQDYIEPRTVKRSFGTGILMFVAFIFINTLATGETPGIFLYIYFFSGLIALSAARISVISMMRGGILQHFDRRWFLGMFGATIVVIGLAGYLSWFFSERVRLIEQIGTVVLGVFAVAVVGVISPVIFIVESFVGGASNQSTAIHQIILALDSFRTVLSQIALNLYGFIERIGFLNWIPYLKPIFLWGLVIVIVFLVVSSVANWVIKERQSREEEKGSVLSANEVVQLIKDALFNQLKRFGESLVGASRLLPGRGWLAAARIRRIYAELLELGEKLGKPRPQANTPLEYLPELLSIFPDLTQEITVITGAYLQVRYGEIPETPEELEQVESAWSRVHAQGKEAIQLKFAAQKKALDQ